MQQTIIYKSIVDSGFTVCEFMDNPESFGSWLIIFKQGHQVMRAAFDGRDAFLSLAKKIENNQWQEIQGEHLDSSSLDEVQALKLVSWLNHATT